MSPKTAIGRSAARAMSIASSAPFSGLSLPATGAPGRAGARGAVGRPERISYVGRGIERTVIAASIDDVHAADAGAGRRIEVHGVPATYEPAREVGQKRLRTADLRLPDRSDQGSDEREPH